MLTPLQFAVPGGPELLIALVVLLILGAIAGVLVYRDARERGSRWAWLWGVGVGLLFLPALVPGLLGVIVYLLVRPDFPDSQVI